jgi:hypothetical protein
MVYDHVEAFLPPYGRVSFDVSETQKMIEVIEKNATLDVTTKARLAAAARSRLLIGFRENSWLLVAKGTDYELASRASMRACRAHNLRRGPSRSWAH